MQVSLAGPFTRVLLVKPTGSTGLAFALHPIPLGLESIAAAIHDRVDAVALYDQFMEPRRANFGQVLRKFKPDLVAFSMSATEHDSGTRLMQLVKRHDPRVPVIAGGYHPTGAPDLVLAATPADMVCRGEGEELMRELVAGTPLPEIAGLSYREQPLAPGTAKRAVRQFLRGELGRGGGEGGGGEQDGEHGTEPSNGLPGLVHNPPRPFADLNVLPFPLRALRRIRGYEYRNNLLIGRAYDQMEFGRGCYGRCTFCCEPYMSRGKQRYKSPARAMAEIREIWEFHGARPLRILIGDPHVLGQPRQVDALCDLLLAAGLDVTFQVMSRPDMIVRHPALVEKMVRAGMISWEVGVESPTQDDLDRTRKQVSRDMQDSAIGILRRVGAETLGTFVVGLPHHTHAFLREFPDYAREIGLAAAAFGIATPFPGTPYWDELATQGLIFETDWTKYDENHCVFRHPTMTPAQIELARTWCLARFWNLDTVLEQLRLDHQRVGRFRDAHKTPVAQFFQAVFRKLKFAADAGSELAGASTEAKAAARTGSPAATLAAKGAQFVNYARFMFDAWVTPRLEQYFARHPVHQILDMQAFGKLVGGARWQVVVEDRARGKCLFVLHVRTSPAGIETLATSRTPWPARETDFTFRADLPRLFIDPDQPMRRQIWQFLRHLRRGVLRFEGRHAGTTIAKLVGFFLVEALRARLAPATGTSF